MKYSMVKQFSNGALDNVYTFFYKIVDFGKIMIEVFWAFVEIWQAFFLIFFNIAMYMYYLFLFIIDFSADESKGTILSFRRKKSGVSRTPNISIPKGPNPIPAKYGKIKETAQTVATAASSAAESIKPAPSGGGAKKPIVKTTLEFFSNLFGSIYSVITAPFRVIAGFFGPKLKPVKEDQVASDSLSTARPGTGSLIDQYMKEYEQKRR